MKRKALEFLSENGKLSMMRLMALASLLVGIVIAIAGLCMGRDLTGVAELAAVFIVPAFGGKLLQKHAESE